MVVEIHRVVIPDVLLLLVLSNGGLALLKSRSSPLAGREHGDERE